MPQREKSLQRSLIVAVLVGIAVVVGLMLAYRLLVVLELIAVAALVALILRTIARGLERTGASPITIAVFLLLGIGAVGALVYFVIVPDVAKEVGVLVSNGPNSLNAMSKVIDNLPVNLDLSQLVGRLKSYLSGIVGAAPQIVFGVVGALAALVGVIFLALYLAVSPETYVRGLLRLVPLERREEVREFLHVLAERLRGWIVGTVLIATCVGVSGGIGLWILGIPLALTFGILAGVLDIIPFFGSIVGGALPALLALTISPLKAVEVVVLFVVINQVEGNILQPRLMGRQVHLPSALILVSILSLATLLGPVIGTLLAIPTAVVVVTIAEHLTEESPKEEPSKDEPSKGESQKVRDS